MEKRNLVLVRHGQSEWNAKNLFTGWKDPDLTELGLNEAENAGDRNIDGTMVRGCGKALRREQQGVQIKIHNTNGISSIFISANARSKELCRSGEGNQQAAH